MSRASEKLFVYGTLRRGHVLHSRLVKMNAKYLGSGRIGGALFDLGKYPGAFPSGSRRSRIHGELYELASPEDQLKALDRLEEYFPKRPRASLFVRRRATVHLNGGRRGCAGGYFLPKRPSEAAMIARGGYNKPGPARALLQSLEHGTRRGQ